MEQGPDQSDNRHWAGWTFEECRDEVKPSLGGTLDTPPHEPTERAPVARLAWWIVGGLTVFALLQGSLWALDALGWRRTVAAVSSLLLIAGMGMLYWRLSPGDAKQLWRNEVRDGRDPEPSRCGANRAAASVGARAPSWCACAACGPCSSP